MQYRAIEFKSMFMKDYKEYLFNDYYVSLALCELHT